MRVVLADKAKSQLAGLAKTTQIRIIKKLLYVEEAKDMSFFRLRIGDYRAIGSVQEETFIVLYVGHRSKVYKDFD